LKISLRSSHSIHVSALAAIFIVALGLRLWGISFGLPYEYHVDEDQYVRQAATMGSSGLKPADWFNPPLFKYMLLSEYGFLYLAGKTLGWFSSTADFGAKMTLDPTWLYLLARGTSAILGSLTVLVVAWIGAKAYSLKVGLFGAALMAVAFLPVRESHFAVNDSAAAFFISIVILASVGILKSGNIRWYIMAGIALGLAFATKYHALAAAIPVLLAHFLSTGIRTRKTGFHKLIIVFAIAAASTILASPYFALSPQEILTDITALSRAGQIGYMWQIDPQGGYLFYLKTLLWGLGWLLAGLCIVTAVIAPFRRNPVDLVLLCLPWVMFLYLGSQEMYFGRFMLPLIAPLILVSISLLFEIVSKIVHKNSWQSATLLMLGIILAVQPLVASTRFDSLLTQTDTRTLAKAWIEQNIPDDAYVAMDWPYHCPPLSTTERVRADSSRKYQVWISNFGSGTGLSDHSIEWYRKNGYQYLIACSSLYELNLTDETQNPGRRAFYTSLEQELDLIYAFYPS
jgi:hypothetical protein